MSYLTTKRSFESLIPEDRWLPVNGQVASLVRTWSGQNDLVASIGNQFGGPTAFFSPDDREIQINTDVAFGEETQPESIGDLNDREVQFEWPKASGMIFHEASHAKYTTWDMREAAEKLSEKENGWLHLLEESRMEGIALQEHPENRAFLRACTLDVVLRGESSEVVAELSTIRRAARMTALVLARVDNGVLKKKDVKEIKKQIDQLIPESTMSQLRDIWREFQGLRYPERQIKRMYALAKRWSKLIDDLAADEDRQEQEQKDMLSELLDQLLKELGGQAEGTEISAQGEAYDQQDTERREREAQERTQREAEKSNNENVSKSIFDKPVDLPVGNGSGSNLTYKTSMSAVAYTRPPTDEENIAAIRVSRALEQAKYHDRIRIEHNSVLPPGRMRTRAAVQGAAYRSLNIHTKVEPFRRVQRKHAIDPNLTVGVMFDKSGSMSQAMEPMGVTGWIMSSAVNRIDGNFAMVTYGHDVRPVVKPKERQREVVVYEAPDGSEAFGQAFQALDGALNLLDGQGARLLVIVSDGNYKGVEQETNVARWLKRCDQEGVAVLWLGYGQPYGATAHVQGTNAQLIIPERTPTGVAEQIGKAAIDLLMRAGS